MVTSHPSRYLNHDGTAAQLPLRLRQQAARPGCPCPFKLPAGASGRAARPEPAAPEPGPGGHRPRARRFGGPGTRLPVAAAAAKDSVAGGSARTEPATASQSDSVDSESLFSQVTSHHD